MYVAKKNTGFFVVADPEFEKNNKIFVKPVSLDTKLIARLFVDIKRFWSSVIFKKMYTDL